jgi:hypothetical protein
MSAFTKYLDNVKKHPNRVDFGFEAKKMADDPKQSPMIDCHHSWWWKLRNTVIGTI